MGTGHVFTSLNVLPGKELAKGVTMRPLAGEHVMMSYVDLAPHSAVPLHSHPHEQLGVVLEGEIEMQIGDERRSLRTGDAYVIPGGTPHGARATHERARVLDIFYPLREDYLTP
ncbi:MAG TPA: cupin domain-containing protein [bacterium]|nr:cupin domain-containing protein [bacterium]